MSSSMYRTQLGEDFFPKKTGKTKDMVHYMGVLKPDGTRVGTCGASASKYSTIISEVTCRNCRKIFSKRYIR